MVLALPLELAAVSSRTDNFYLRKRKRKQWWSVGHFPKVPAEHLEDVELPEPPITIWQKLLPLGLIFFCASFNLTILQNLKDAIMVTVAGAETLPWLASFCVLPASLAFFMIYGWLVTHLRPNAVFYAAVAPLVLFYIFFATALYPASAWLHPHGMYSNLASHVPVGLHGLLKVVENWTFSLFFCIAELWGSVVISVLFWSLANDVCDVQDAKTIYPLMGISANFALVVAGNYMKFVNTNLTQGSMLVSLRLLVGTVVAMTAVMMGAKAWVDNSIKRPEDIKPPRKKKTKGSLGESFAVLKSSPKILSLAMLVMSYGVSHRLFEFAWKGQLRVLFPSAQAYQGVLADVSIATGSVTIGLMLTGRFVFQYLGWGVAAAATPVVMAITGSAFFGLSLAAQYGTSLTFGPYSLAAAGVMAGAVTQVFARSAKFSLFDPAKEMVYIEMSKEEKSKGKAAVDLLGSQIGKSGASWITQALLLCLGSIQRSMPIIAATFLAVITAWITSVRLLNKQLQEADTQLTRSSDKDATKKPEGPLSPAPAVNENGATAKQNGASPNGHTASENGASRDIHRPKRWPGSVTDGFGDDGEDSAGAQPGFEPVRTDNLDNGEGPTAAVNFRRTQPGSA
ncbi:hypothetical protein ABBQ38_007368 [Trebouxia sp. C0009 RCD-2024]